MKNSKLHRAAALAAAAAMVISLAGCSGSTAAENPFADYADSTLTAQVTAIDGDNITLALGEAETADPAQGGQQGDGQMPADGQQGDGQTPPDLPSDGTSADSTSGGTDTQTPPDKPADDSSASGSTDAANAAAPQDNGQGGGQMPSGGNGGSAPQGNGQGGGQMPSGGNGGSAPQGNGQQGDGQTPPSQPDGSSSDGASGGTDTQTPPEKPADGSSASGSTDAAGGGSASGSAPQDNGPGGGQMPSGGSGGDMSAGGPGSVTFTANGTTLTVTAAQLGLSADDLAVDDILTITVASDGTVTAEKRSASDPGAQGGGFGGSRDVTQGTAAATISEDGSVSGETYSSTGDDENALRVDGATVTLDGITVEKTAGATSNTENGDFYGVNAGLLATNGAQVTITNATVNTSAQNGNGVFSYGSGTVVNISDSTIHTTADNSGGIQTTGGGTTNASNLTVTTEGNSSAAIRSDRGGGTVNVIGGTYTSKGLNSPAVYSTADITVSDAVLTAENSEALVIEGANSISLTNCTVSGCMSSTDGTSSDENVHNVMIYQSMSGDAAEGTSSFSMTGGSLTCNNGDMFYVTNTGCVITLQGAELVQNDADGALFTISGNSASHGWGTAGANGASVTLTCIGQTLNGAINVDAISSLDLSLTENSTLNGTVNITENAQGGTSDTAAVNVTIDAGSTWNLTGNCTVTTLTNNGTINYNGCTITLADGTVLNG